MQIDVYYLEDEADLREIFLDEFSSEKVRVKVFANSHDLFDSVKKCVPDVIFLDYRLPGENGEKVAELLPSSIPKYLVTGELNVKTEFEFLAILAKPLDFEKIHIVLEGIMLNKKQSNLNIDPSVIANPEPLPMVL